jgi:hypothetical protein
MKTRHGSPLVVHVKATPTLRIIPRYSIIFFGPTSHFVKSLACNLSRYCICSLYCC